MKKRKNCASVCGYVLFVNKTFECDSLKQNVNLGKEINLFYLFGFFVSLDHTMIVCWFFRFKFDISAKTKNVKLAVGRSVVRTSKLLVSFSAVATAFHTTTITVDEFFLRLYFPGCWSFGKSRFNWIFSNKFSFRFSHRRRVEKIDSTTSDSIRIELQMCLGRNSIDVISCSIVSARVVTGKFTMLAEKSTTVWSLWNHYLVTES